MESLLISAIFRKMERIKASDVFGCTQRIGFSSSLNCYKNLRSFRRVVVILFVSSFFRSTGRGRIPLVSSARDEFRSFCEFIGSATCFLVYQAIVGLSLRLSCRVSYFLLFGFVLFQGLSESPFFLGY